jgi:hypothetical protein
MQTSDSAFADEPLRRGVQAPIPGWIKGLVVVLALLLIIIIALFVSQLGGSDSTPAASNVGAWDYRRGGDDWNQVGSSGARARAHARAHTRWRHCGRTHLRCSLRSRCWAAARARESAGRLRLGHPPEPHQLQHDRNHQPQPLPHLQLPGRGPPLA